MKGIDNLEGLFFSNSSKYVIKKGKGKHWKKGQVMVAPTKKNHHPGGRSSTPEEP
jgi:hypothetical protein